MRLNTAFVVDNVLEDCFQLISLFYMTIGHNNEAPARFVPTLLSLETLLLTYFQLCIVIDDEGIISHTYNLHTLTARKRLLDHLKEVGFYSAKDLDSIESYIEKMRDSLQRGKEKYSPHLITLLSNRLDVNQAVLNDLKASIPRLCSSLSPLYEKLVSILRSMAAANTRTCVSYLLELRGMSDADEMQFPKAEVQGFQNELRGMEASMKDGKFVKENGDVLENQDSVLSLHHRCLMWAEIVLER